MSSLCLTGKNQPDRKISSQPIVSRNLRWTASTVAPKGDGFLRKSGDGKQLVGCLVQMFFGSVRGREVPNELSGQFVYVDAPKIVDLLTFKTENAGSADRRDMDALAVEDFSVHGKSYSAT